MTTNQRYRAYEIARDLPYTGFNDLLIYADGSWISPADAPRIEHKHQPAMLFRWEQMVGGAGYSYVRTYA